MDFKLIRKFVESEAIIGICKSNVPAFEQFVSYSLEDVKDVIPAGRYKIVPQGAWSKYAGYPRLMPDPPGRAGILFHSGNDVDDTLACVLLGYGHDNDSARISDSQIAIKDFRALLFKDKEDFIEIIDEVSPDLKMLWRNGNYLKELEAKKKQDAALSKL